MLTGQDLFLKDFGALALVDARDLEDLGRIEPTVGASAHDGDAVYLHLVDGDARVDGLGRVSRGRGGKEVREQRARCISGACPSGVAGRRWWWSRRRCG